MLWLQPFGSYKSKEACFSTKKNAAPTQKLKLGLGAACEELRHCGALLADGMGILQLQPRQHWVGVMPPLEDCAMALMNCLAQLDQLGSTVTDIELASTTAEANGTGDTPRAVTVLSEQRRLLAMLGESDDLLRDAAIARELLQLRAEQQEREVVQLTAGRRVLLRKLQDIGDSQKVSEGLQQGAHAQLSSLQQIVLKGHSEQTSMGKKLSKAVKKAEVASQKVARLLFLSVSLLNGSTRTRTNSNNRPSYFMYFPRVWQDVIHCGLPHRCRSWKLQRQRQNKSTHGFVRACRAWSSKWGARGQTIRARN